MKRVASLFIGGAVGNVAYNEWSNYVRQQQQKTVLPHAKSEQEAREVGTVSGALSGLLARSPAGFLMMYGAGCLTGSYLKDNNQWPDIDMEQAKQRWEQTDLEEVKKTVKKTFDDLWK